MKQSKGASTLRAGIIGLSWIAGDPAGEASTPYLGTATPYSHASAMAAIGDIDVVAVCDLRPEAGTAFVDQWAGTWPNVEAHTDLETMLATQLDLVSVVTPDHLHGRMIEQCLDAGVRMIFSEKPFTTDLAEADHIIGRITETGASIAVNHTWRWRPEIAATKAMVQREDLGPLSHITVEAGGPRAMLFRNLSHFLDLAIHLTGEDPDWVIAELEPGTGDYGVTYSGDGGQDPALDPGASVLIGFPSGVRAFVTGLKRSLPDVAIQVLCRDGRVTLDTLGARIIEVPRTVDGTPGSVSGPAIRPLRAHSTVSGMQAGLADLISSHRSGQEPTGSARTARRTVAVIDAILRSSSSGSARVAVTSPPD